MSTAVPCSGGWRPSFDGSVRSVGRAGLHPNSITLIYKRLIRSAFDKKLLGPLTDAELKTLAFGGVEPFDPGGGGAGQFCGWRESPRDHAGLSLARSQDCHALWRQTGDEEWGRGADGSSDGGFIPRGRRRVKRRDDLQNRSSGHGRKARHRCWRRWVEWQGSSMSTETCANASMKEDWRPSEIIASSK